MRSLRWLFLAALLAPCHAFAQTTVACPQLPADGGLRWETSEGPDFLYCKAMRDADRGQAFGVMLRQKSTFREYRARRMEESVIGGRKVHWYRGVVSFQPDAIVRETLVELDNGLTAHIMLRADSEEERAETQRLVERLQFQNDANPGGR